MKLPLYFVVKQESADLWWVIRDLHGSVERIDLPFKTLEGAQAWASIVNASLRDAYHRQFQKFARRSIDQ